MDEHAIKYSVKAFAENVNENRCRYIGGGLKGSQTLCTKPVQSKGSYCEEHYALCHKKARKVNIEGIVS